MPPKLDPYATRSAWTVDAALILFAVLTIVVVICTAPRSRRAPAPVPPPVASEVAPPPTADTSPNDSARLAGVTNPNGP